MAAFRTLAVWLSWLLLLFTTFVSASSLEKRMPRIGLWRGYNLEKSRKNLTSTSEDLKTFYYDQTLDHFNYRPESYATFKQRYVINFKHWGGRSAAAPILVFFGEESNLDNDLNGIGWLSDNAPRFKALQVYIEHRYYGESIPFGLKQEDMLKNATLRGYFNSAQALADYAEVILHIKKKLSADSSPIFVIGGSYGGMLAAWFRLKYPHIAMGALASSAPVLYFDNITPSNAYYYHVTKDFREVSESCYETIKQSWVAMDEAAAKSNGLTFLSEKFKTCKPLEDASELKDYFDTLYSAAAQYDTPPTYPVNMICKGIDGGSEGTDILGRIFSGMVSYRGNKSCYDLDEFFSSETLDGWSWQTCSDLVIPVGRGEDDTMFPAAPFNLTETMESCKQTFGVYPRPHWVTTYFGGHHFKEVLESFGSNIIFSNGLRDPYSSAGVLEDISDSIIAVAATKGSHCLDIVQSSKDDPEWLVNQRITEVKIVQSWFLKYYADLLQTSARKGTSRL